MPSALKLEAGMSQIGDEAWLPMDPVLQYVLYDADDNLIRKTGLSSGKVDQWTMAITRNIIPSGFKSMLEFETTLLAKIDKIFYQEIFEELYQQITSDSTI